MIVESAGQIQALEQDRRTCRGPEEVYEALSELVFGEKGKTRATGMLARPALAPLTGAELAPDGLASGVASPAHRPAHPLDRLRRHRHARPSWSRRRAAAGLDVLAITDHDTTAGWDAAAAALPGRAAAACAAPSSPA